RLVEFALQGAAALGVLVEHARNAGLNGARRVRLGNDRFHEGGEQLEILSGESLRLILGCGGGRSAGGGDGDKRLAARGSWHERTYYRPGAEEGQDGLVARGWIGRRGLR